MIVIELIQSQWSKSLLGGPSPKQMYFDHIQNINNANYSNLPFIWQLFNNIFYTLTRDHRRIAMVQYTFTGHFFLKFLIISYIKKKILRIQQLIESISRSSRKKMCKKSVAIRTFFKIKSAHTRNHLLLCYFSKPSCGRVWKDGNPCITIRSILIGQYWRIKISMIWDCTWYMSNVFIFNLKHQISQ